MLGLKDTRLALDNSARPITEAPANDLRFSQRIRLLREEHLSMERIRRFQKQNRFPMMMMQMSVKAAVIKISENKDSEIRPQNPFSPGTETLDGHASKFLTDPPHPNPSREKTGPLLAWFLSAAFYDIPRQKEKVSHESPRQNYGNGIPKDNEEAEYGRLHYQRDNMQG
ncbi:hypothetical protein CEXT_88301 [Caerostris extrusa]|uniref:Uncharacterized protein n=1 Tax=Caerostris extrusa TaxID=172846 RepID=A0AAV4UG35_CAEEX|nr:hypothetical protein CEXT_88301 [Caerostris extrusa]